MRYAKCAATVIKINCNVDKIRNNIKIIVRKNGGRGGIL
jgi:hypothetical protein